MSMMPFFQAEYEERLLALYAEMRSVGFESVVI
jgi:hypothetical protein